MVEHLSVIEHYPQCSQGAFADNPRNEQKGQEGNRDCYALKTKHLNHHFLQHVSDVRKNTP